MKRWSWVFHPTESWKKEIKLFATTIQGGQIMGQTEFKLTIIVKVKTKYIMTQIHFKQNITLDM